ncbi:MAG: hypothetical protein K0R29_1167 [Pseudobdellovibrio sp.]|jgi:hypothetical protein|nr:hypothetical protein [Pseudobdellovibrio sp.]
MKLKSAVSKIEKNGVLLVFPINNKPQPHSLWSEFYPKKKMNWDWDESGDNRVFDMWSLMKRLSEGGEVVYSKWYQGRATFFSKKLFTALIRLSISQFSNPTGISRPAREILEVLEQDSPLSTKKLKQICELQGKDNARIYDRAMKELFSNFLIVGYGEVDDGAFPSLAIGATKTIFEELYLAAETMSEEQARSLLNEYMPEESLFRKYYEKYRQRTPKEKEVE